MLSKTCMRSMQREKPSFPRSKSRRKPKRKVKKKKQRVKSRKRELKMKQNPKKLNKKNQHKEKEKKLLNKKQKRNKEKNKEPLKKQRKMRMITKLCPHNNSKIEYMHSSKLFLMSPSTSQGEGYYKNINSLSRLCSPSESWKDPNN